MGRSLIVAILSLTTALMGARYAVAGQAPAAASDPDIPLGHQDRVYSAEQYSNTVSVTDPVDNKLLGTATQSKATLLALNAEDCRRNVPSGARMSKQSCRTNNLIQPN